MEIALFWEETQFCPSPLVNVRFMARALKNNTENSKTIPQHKTCLKEPNTALLAVLVDSFCRK